VSSAQLEPENANDIHQENKVEGQREKTRSVKNPVVIRKSPALAYVEGWNVEEDCSEIDGHDYNW
jgi:hypothetical protein